MKKGLIIFVLLALSISYISAAVTFPASNVKINVGSFPMSLQEAANGGNLRGTLSYYSSSTSILPGDHDASQIWVNVNGNEQTLLSALSTTNGICGSGTYSTYSGAVPSPGHVGTEVILSSGKSLQKAINDKDFCYTNTYSWVIGSWSSCPSTCGGAISRTVYCRRNFDGVSVADSFCTGTKPVSTGSCSCSWNFTAWGSCPVACGGSRSRTVYCTTSPGNTTVADSYCPAASKPSTTLACSCKYVDNPTTISCDSFIFWDTCLPGLACSTPSSPPSGGWHCLYHYPGDSCGFLNLGMERYVLSCKNV